MFSASSLSEAEAILIAEAYYRCGKNPKQMAAALGVPRFDLELIRHPLVKRQIVKLAERMRVKYSLDDHLERLQEIRDRAMEDGNLRIALAAELSVGKAAGLYERLAEDEAAPDKLQELTTAQIKERLARLEAASPAPVLITDSHYAEVEDQEL